MQKLLFQCWIHIFVFLTLLQTQSSHTIPSLWDHPDIKNVSVSESFRFAGYRDITEPDQNKTLWPLYLDLSDKLTIQSSNIDLKRCTSNGGGGGVTLSGWLHPLKLAATNWCVKMLLWELCLSFSGILTKVCDISLRPQEFMPAFEESS